MPTPQAPSTVPAWTPWALVAITLAAGAFRLQALTAEEPWFDEVFSIVLASQDLPELFRRAIADQTNPPGFYLLLWGWTRLGGFGLAWMRLLPVLAGTLTVPAVALAAHRLRLSRSGVLIAASLAAASPLLLAMSSELRAYAIVALVSALMLATAAHGRHGLVAVGGVALVMLHYFGAFVVAALAVGTLWVERHRGRAALRAALVASVPAAVALMAWLIVVARASGERAVGGNASWITGTGVRALTGFATQVVGGFATPAGAFVAAAILAASLVVALRSIRGTPATGAPDPDPHLAVSLAVLPLLCIAAITLLTGRELWVGRYLVITLPGWCVLVAFAVARLRGRISETAVAALLTWSSLAGIHAERTREKKTTWSLVARAITAGAARTICVNESFVGLPLRYHALTNDIPLTVLDLSECAAARAPSAMILRPGTEAALARVTAAGAEAGAARDLGTTLPPTVLVPLRWPSR